MEIEGTIFEVISRLMSWYIQPRMANFMVQKRLDLNIAKSIETFGVKCRLCGVPYRRAFKIVANCDWACASCPEVRPLLAPRSAANVIICDCWPPKVCCDPCVPHVLGVGKDVGTLMKDVTLFIAVSLFAEDEP